MGHDTMNIYATRDGAQPSIQSQDLLSNNTGNSKGHNDSQKNGLAEVNNTQGNQ